MPIIILNPDGHGPSGLCPSYGFFATIGFIQRFLWHRDVRVEENSGIELLRASITVDATAANSWGQPALRAVAGEKSGLRVCRRLCGGAPGRCFTAVAAIFTG